MTEGERGRGSGGSDGGGPRPGALRSFYRFQPLFSGKWQPLMGRAEEWCGLANVHKESLWPLCGEQSIGEQRQSKVKMRHGGLGQGRGCGVEKEKVPGLYSKGGVDGCCWIGVECKTKK